MEKYKDYINNKDTIDFELKTISAKVQIGLKEYLRSLREKAKNWVLTGDEMVIDYEEIKKFTKINHPSDLILNQPIEEKSQITPEKQEIQ